MRRYVKTMRKVNKEMERDSFQAKLSGSGGSSDNEFMLENSLDREIDLQKSHYQFSDEIKPDENCNEILKDLVREITQSLNFLEAGSITVFDIFDQISSELKFNAF